MSIGGGEMRSNPWHSERLFKNDVGLHGLLRHGLKEDGQVRKSEVQKISTEPFSHRTTGPRSSLCSSACRQEGWAVGTEWGVCIALARGADLGEGQGLFGSFCIVGTFSMNLVSRIPCIIRGNRVLAASDCLGLHLGPAITNRATPGKSVLLHL